MGNQELNWGNQDVYKKYRDGPDRTDGQGRKRSAAARSGTDGPGTDGQATVRGHITYHKLPIELPIYFDWVALYLVRASYTSIRLPYIEVGLPILQWGSPIHN